MAQEAGEKELLTAARGPWMGGYTSSVPGFMARPDQLIGTTTGLDDNSSRNVNIDPFTGSASRRAGCAVVNDTLSAGLEINGILNAKFNARCRKLSALDSPSLTDGYPTLMGLFGEDTNASFPTADSGFHATLWVKAGSSNYSLLEEFVNNSTYSNDPSTKATNADYDLKVVPIWMESGDGVYHRGAPIGTSGTDKFMQQFMCAGSRSFLQTQHWLYSPNLRCTPWRWNKRFNESIATETVRIFPTGPFPPLFPPTATTPSADTSGTSWSDGDTAYLSVAFVRDDGSPSAPFIPRQANAILSSGIGLMTVGTIGGSSKYRYVTYSNIAIGPEGTTKRVILRSVKQNRTASTDNITISPLDLRIIGVLNNNTQTTFIDYGGDDSSLLEDDDFVAVDWICPRRARFIGTGDSRAIISYTLPNTAAIMLAPVSVNNATTYDLNAADTGSVYSSSNAFYVRITSTDLELHKQNGATAATYVTAPTYVGTTENAVKFPLATYDTVEKMVDAINVTLITSQCGLWRAQLAPGIDPTMPTASLTKTTLALAVTGTSTTTLTGAAADIAQIGIGMKVNGTNVTAGTYVVSKASNGTQITISTATTGAPGATTNFSSYTGDTESITVGGSASYGYMRAFCPAWPVLLHMKPSAFPDYATPDKTSVYFTNASPGAASSGISLAPNSFTAANRRLPSPNPNPRFARACMGIVDIEGAGIVAYNDGIYMFANQRGANTGEDFDCRLFDVSNTRGCISYLGLCAGNGWAAFPTTEGIVVTDKNRREYVISGDIFNPTENVGDLAYEIGVSAASASGDTDDQYLGMNIRGSKLVVTYRRNANSPCEVAYNFSPGVEASGVEEMLNPDSKTPYIWNPPAVYNGNSNLGAIGAIGSFINASGRLDYISFESNLGTGDGRVEQVGTGVLDNSGAHVAYAIAAPVVAREFMALSPQDVEVTHKNLAADSGVCQLEFANDQSPTFNSTTLARALPVNSSKVQFQKQTVPIDERQRGKTDLFWMQWRSTEQSVTPRVWRMVLRYTEVQAGSGSEQ